MTCDISLYYYSIKQHHLSNFENQLSLGPRKSSPSSQPKLKWQGGVDEFNPLAFGIERNGTHHWNRMESLKTQNATGSDGIFSPSRRLWGNGVFKTLEDFCG